MRRQLFNWKRPMSPTRTRARAVVADFGRNVRERRLAAGLRQTDLARLCHTGADMICHIEKGQTNPSLETMALVAFGLGCNVADLLPTTTGKPCVKLREEDMRRAQDAVDTLRSVLMQRRRARCR